MFQEVATEGKSRYEIIMRARISWNESPGRMAQREWIDRELREIGFDPLTDEEIRTFKINTTLRLL